MARDRKSLVHDTEASVGVSGNRRPGTIWIALFAASLTFGTVLAFCPPAQAQSSTAAAAEALFKQGRKLMAAGAYSDACPKFVESQRLDPASGTLLNIGECYEKLGRIASAWAAFKEASSVALKDGHQVRIEYADKHIAKLEPMLSYLTVSMDPARRVPGLKLMVDDVPLNTASLGVPIPLDPGEHEIVISAPGYNSWTKHLKVGQKADSHTIRVPALTKSPEASKNEVKPEADASQGNNARRLETGKDASKGSKTWHREENSRTAWGYAVGGAGVLALGIGSYFGVAALSKWNSRNDHCDPDGCDKTGAAAGRSADTYGYVSDVGIGVGILGIGTGVYLLLTDKGLSRNSERDSARSVSVTPRVGTNTAGLSVGGAW